MKTEVVNSLNFADVFNLVMEPANRGTMLITKEYIDLVEKRRLRTGRTSISLIEKYYTNLWYCILFQKFSPFYESFNEKLDQLIASGIIKHWWNYEAKKHPVEEKEPQVLQFSDLEVGFTICLFFAMISLIVFAIECLLHIVTRYVSRVVNEYRSVFKELLK